MDPFLNPKKMRFLDSYSALGSAQTIYLDHLISPDCWKNKYTRIFGKIHFYLEQCTIVFASILFAKLILVCLVFTIKALHVNRQ